MKRMKWSVDWSDAAYPMITPWSEGEYGDPLTFTEAKAEVDEHFASLCQHNHEQRDRFRKMTQAECFEEWNRFNEDE